MRNAYLSALYDLAAEDRNVMALISDNGAIVYDKYRARFSAQYFNMGISEANMVSVAAGLASCGKVPFAYTISNFLVYRAFEQIRNDVCLQKMNVKLVGIGVGFVYSNLGPTHHGTEDIALMRSLPGMTVFSPADPREASHVTRAAYDIHGPVYIRLATGGSPRVYDDEYDFRIGKGVVLKEGDDLAIISTGSIVSGLLPVIDELKREGLNARLINMHTLKPIDKEIIIKAAEETGAILSIEEQNVNGGLGSAIAEVLAENEACGVKFKRMGLYDSFSSGYGSYEDMKAQNGLSNRDVLRVVNGFLSARAENPGQAWG